MRMFKQMRDELAGQQDSVEQVVHQENEELVNCRKRVIELQDDLIQCKNEQLKTLQMAKHGQKLS